MHLFIQYWEPSTIVGEWNIAKEKSWYFVLGGFRLQAGCIVIQKNLIMLKYANTMKEVNEVKYFLKSRFLLIFRLKIGRIYLKQILG